MRQENIFIIFSQDKTVLRSEFMTFKDKNGPNTLIGSLNAQIQSFLLSMTTNAIDFILCAVEEAGKLFGMTSKEMSGKKQIWISLDATRWLHWSWKSDKVYGLANSTTTYWLQEDLMPIRRLWRVGSCLTLKRKESWLKETWISPVLKEGSLCMMLIQFLR